MNFLCMVTLQFYKQLLCPILLNFSDNFLIYALDFPTKSFVCVYMQIIMILSPLILKSAMKMVSIC